MNKKIQSALISVFYKDGLEPVVTLLSELGVTIYSTGGTQTFIESLGISCVPVESLTTYPSILGGRVKTLHPAVFGGILGKRDDAQHMAEMAQYKMQLGKSFLICLATVVANRQSPFENRCTSKMRSLFIVLLHYHLCQLLQCSFGLPAHSMNK